jgi:L-asparaginase
LLARKMNGVLAREDIEGVVYVQGTNTLEETAYFLNLTVRSDKPLIIVGAQRPFTGLSTDAHLNLVNAIRVAACEEARGKGVVTVTNSEINAARDVTKTSTCQVQTFRSRDLGLLGYADPDRIVFYRAPLRRHTMQSEFDIMANEGISRPGGILDMATEMEIIRKSGAWFYLGEDRLGQGREEFLWIGDAAKCHHRPPG